MRVCILKLESKDTFENNTPHRTDKKEERYLGGCKQILSGIELRFMDSFVKSAMVDCYKLFL